jgi:hypothetical protein
LELSQVVNSTKPTEECCDFLVRLFDPQMHGDIVSYQFESMIYDFFDSRDVSQNVIELLR